MQLKDYVKKGQIIFHDGEISKSDSINILCKSLCDSYALDYEHVREMVWEREEKMTTGIGGNVAVPHARLDGIDNFYIAIMINKEGIDFDALDGRPVNIITLLLSPRDMVKEHIALLSKLSYFLTEEDSHRILLEASTIADVEALAKKF